MRLETDVKLDYSDVLIRPKRSTLESRKDVDLTRKFTFRNAKPVNDEHYEGVPIMASNMDGVGTFGMALELTKQNIFTCLVKTYSTEELLEYFLKRRDHVAMSIGITDPDFDKFKTVYEGTRRGNLRYACIDVANGYSERFVTFVKDFRTKYPEIVIIAGNVCTGEMTEELLISGADIIKIGLGPGSACTTRIQTGVGYPQLSAVIECADAAHGLGGHIIADGGCTCPADVAKAYGAGADFVMLGGMFAGHTEGGGKIISKQYETDEVENYGTEKHRRIVIQKQFIEFYGMSSDAANKKHFGGLKDYRSSEGREVLVHFRGKVENTVQNILGGIRSACTYVGAGKLKELMKRTTFILCNNTHNRVFETK